MIEALTTSCRPSLSANRAMISSGALPKVTFSRPPMPGPASAASSSVARPISAAVGMIPRAATTKMMLADAPARSSTIASGISGTSMYGTPPAVRKNARFSFGPLGGGAHRRSARAELRAVRRTWRADPGSRPWRRSRRTSASLLPADPPRAARPPVEPVPPRAAESGVRPRARRRGRRGSARRAASDRPAPRSSDPR